MPQDFLKFMETEDAFLHNFFSCTSQGCYEKAKESVVCIVKKVYACYVLFLIVENV